MKRLVAILFMFTSIGFGDFFGGDLRREFGIKIGFLNVDYNSVDGSNKDIDLKEMVSVYGYLGGNTPQGFNAGLSVELITANKFENNGAWAYTSFELNPSIELEINERLYGYTGFGGSINRFKERVNGITNKDTALGLQFFLGAKYKVSEIFGFLGEYKVKIFTTSDYDDATLHHFNIGVFFRY